MSRQDFYEGKLMVPYEKGIRKMTEKISVDDAEELLYESSSKVIDIIKDYIGFHSQKEHSGRMLLTDLVEPGRLIEEVREKRLSVYKPVLRKAKDIGLAIKDREYRALYNATVGLIDNINEIIAQNPDIRELESALERALDAMHPLSRHIEREKSYPAKFLDYISIAYSKAKKVSEKGKSFFAGRKRKPKALKPLKKEPQGL